MLPLIVRTRPPRSVRRRVNSSPQRSTAALSSVGDSRATSASIVSISQARGPDNTGGVVRRDHERSLACAARPCGAYNRWLMLPRATTFAVRRSCVVGARLVRSSRSRGRFRSPPRPYVIRRQRPRRRDAPQPGPPSPGRAARRTDERTLGVPDLSRPRSSITSYDAGRGQRFYLFGATVPFAEHRHLLPDGPQDTRGRAVRDPADASVRDRTLSRRDDGVSAKRDRQGLHVGRLGRVSQPEARGTAAAFPHGHSDRTGAAGPPQ